MDDHLKRFSVYNGFMPHIFSFYLRFFNVLVFGIIAYFPQLCLVSSKMTCLLLEPSSCAKPNLLCSFLMKM